MTNTIIKVSEPTFEEIKSILQQKEYDLSEQINSLKMDGITLELIKHAKSANVFVNGKPFVLPIGNEKITYEDVYKLAFPNSDYINPACVWKLKNSVKWEQSGILKPGQSLRLQNGLYFTISPKTSA